MISQLLLDQDHISRLPVSHRQENGGCRVIKKVCRIRRGQADGGTPGNPGDPFGIVVRDQFAKDGGPMVVVGKRIDG